MQLTYSLKMRRVAYCTVKIGGLWIENSVLCFFQVLYMLIICERCDSKAIYLFIEWPFLNQVGLCGVCVRVSHLAGRGKVDGMCHCQEHLRQLPRMLSLLHRECPGSWEHQGCGQCCPVGSSRRGACVALSARVSGRLASWHGDSAIAHECSYSSREPRARWSVECIEV